MAKLPMGFKNFKKVGGDEHHTIMRHSDGHEIKIAHKPLSPKIRSELISLKSEAPKAMADGGEVKDDVPEPNPKKAADFQRGAMSGPTPLGQAYQNLKEGLGLASPSPKQDSQKGYAEGGEVQQDQQPNPTPAPVTINIGGGMPQMPTNLASVPPAQPMPIDQAQGQQQLPVQASADAPQSSSNTIDYSKLIPQEQARKAVEDAPYGTAQPQQAPAPQQPKVSQLAQVPNAGDQSQQQQSQGSQDPYGTESYLNAYMQGLGEQKAGLAGQAAAEGQMGRQQAVQLNQAIQRQQQAVADYKNNYNKLDQERNSFIQDYQNQHINPNHYLQSMGTGQKISTAIGLILGGLGSGGTGSNPAQAFLHDQITRDIEAQKAEMGKKENLLSANMRQFGNLRDASDMTRVMQMDIVSNQLKEAAAKATDPMAKARALKEAGVLDQQAAPVLSQMAMRRSLMSGISGQDVDPAQKIRMLGTAGIIPQPQQAAMYKELTEAQAMNRAKDNIMGAFDKVIGLNTVSNRLSSPIQSKRQIDSIVDPIVAALSKETAGRFTEQDAQMLYKLFPSAGDNNDTTKTKRNQIVKLITEKMNFPQLNAYGINPISAGRYGMSGDKKIQMLPPVR